MPVKEIAVLTFTGTDSSILYVNRKTLTTLIIPDDAAFDGITFKFKVGMESNKIFTLKNSLNSDVSVTVSKASSVALDLQSFTGAAYIQIIASGSLNGKTILAIFREI